jgi:hypothetical protein
MRVIWSNPPWCGAEAEMQNSVGKTAPEAKLKPHLLAQTLGSVRVLLRNSKAWRSWDAALDLIELSVKLFAARCLTGHKTSDMPENEGLYILLNKYSPPCQLPSANSLSHRQQTTE